MKVGRIPGVLLWVILLVLLKNVSAGGISVPSSSSWSTPYHTGHDDRSCDDSRGDEARVVAVHLHSGDLRVAKKRRGGEPPTQRRRRPFVSTDNITNDGTPDDADYDTRSHGHGDVVAHLVVALDPNAPAGAYPFSLTIIIDDIDTLPPISSFASFETRLRCFFCFFIIPQNSSLPQLAPNTHVLLFSHHLHPKHSTKHGHRRGW